jgi:hypothetical protein
VLELGKYIAVRKSLCVAMYEIKANTRCLDTTKESKISMASPHRRLLGACHSWPGCHCHPRLAPTNPQMAMVPPTQKLPRGWSDLGSLPMLMRLPQMHCYDMVVWVATFRANGLGGGGVWLRHSGTGVQGGEHGRMPRRMRSTAFAQPRT